MLKATRLALLLFFIIAAGLASCKGINLNPPQPGIQATASEKTNTPTVLPPTETPTSSATPTITVTQTPPPPTLTPTPASYGPKDFPANINPLTGLAVAQPELLNRRPVAVKINLVPRTSYRPTWGLSLADIVWDYYHNDGYSRLHAIFYSQDTELAGAIRSGRMPDNDLVQMYKSIFTYGSADALVNFRLLNASYSNRLILEGARSNCPPTVDHPLCRIEPNGPDLLLTGTKELSEHITKLGINNDRQNLDGMAFDSVTPEGGNSGMQAVIRYSIDNYGKWDYDPKNGSYWFSMDSNLASTPQDEVFTPLMDRVTNKQISAQNVVILIAAHQYYQPPPNEIIEIMLSGIGKAYAFRDGSIYEVTWNRPAYDSVLYLTFADGKLYPYKPGNTWYHIIGESSQIKEIEDGIWRFDFRFP